MHLQKLLTAIILLSILNSCADNPEETTTPAQPSKPAATQTAPAANTKSVALNPAHGQPGHRCDIAVGAPLNSAPAATNPPAPAQTAPVVMPTQPAPSTGTGTATGPLNPAHGQPGHRCDIAVGAPLPK
ncbi:MAG: hypothetical protein KGZ74_07615 [Chitinophagaceae bacterium]|nr:hypothetical protein [Chitinophagaceae bacterium]